MTGDRKPVSIGLRTKQANLMALNRPVERKELYVQ